ncbi:hypothetical protein Csa_005802, partial [Cucumis sativus]
MKRQKVDKNVKSQLQIKRRKSYLRAPTKTLPSTNADASFSDEDAPFVDADAPYL